MTLRISLFASFSVFAATSVAWAQAPNNYVESANQVAVGYQGLPSRSVPGQTSGLEVADGNLLHVGVGVEGGYDSNVFFSDTNASGSAILRVVPFLELNNTNRQGMVPSTLFYDLGATLTYREYLSSDPDIKSQRAFQPGVFGTLEFGRQQSLGFAITEAYARTEDPPYIRGDQPITRDNNLATAAARWAPGGGRLAGVLRYTNTLDLFETENLKVANSVSHLMSLDVSWKWLPKTALVLQVSQGYIYYLNSQNGVSKPSSFPFHAMVGLRGLITAKLIAAVLVGYANGFYDMTRQGPTGLAGNLSANAEVTYRPTMLTSMVLGYRRDFQNAVLGDFYYLDSVYLSVGQAIASRFGAGLTVRYDSRSFQNVPLANGALISRHDNFWQVGANLDYHVRDWSYVGIAYTLMSNQSDYEPLAAQDPGRVNFVKQLVFARLGISY